MFNLKKIIYLNERNIGLKKYILSYLFFLSVGKQIPIQRNNRVINLRKVLVSDLYCISIEIIVRGRRLRKFWKIQRSRSSNFVKSTLKYTD